MEKTCMFLCFHVNLKHNNTKKHVFVCFLHLVPTFTPLLHYITMVKSLQQVLVA